MEDIKWCTDRTNDTLNTLQVQLKIFSQKDKNMNYM